MESTPRPEILHSHVPLAFLLGRRACEYRLPTLDVHPRRRRKPRETSLFQDDKLHVRRQREEQAKQLLERVLAQESRLETNQTNERETSQGVRVATAGRRHRAAALQRVLNEDKATTAAASNTDSVESPAVSLASGNSHSRLYDQRELFASTHGFAPRDPDFVEVVGNPARIQRAQSLRQFHEDEKLRRAKQFRVKQSRIPAMQAQLLAQQAGTKAKLLLHAERSIQRKDTQPEDAVGSPVASDAVRARQTTVKHRKDEQQCQLQRIKDDEKRQLHHRRETVQRARQDIESAIKARIVSSEMEKKTMAKIRGVGPSFVSTLRVDPDDERRLVDVRGDGALIFLETSSADGSSDAEDGLGDRLRAHQYELFQQSQARSLHLGGGFASKPRDLSQRKHRGDSHGDGRDDHDDHDALAAHAKGIALVNSKRQVQDEWKRTLSVHQ
jgi:hypothetical protein